MSQSASVPSGQVTSVIPVCDYRDLVPSPRGRSRRLLGSCPAHTLSSVRLVLSSSALCQSDMLSEENARIRHARKTTFKQNCILPQILPRQCQENRKALETLNANPALTRLLLCISGRNSQLPMAPKTFLRLSSWENRNMQVPRCSGLHTIRRKLPASGRAPAGQMLTAAATSSRLSASCTSSQRPLRPHVVLKKLCSHAVTKKASGK